MQSHVGFTDFEFIQALGRKEILPFSFTHEAHLRLSWILLRKYPLKVAQSEAERIIRNHVKLVGASEKYHHTITLAAIQVVNHFMGKSDKTCFLQWLDANPALRNDFKRLLGAHYSDQILYSESARKNYVQPDLMEF